MLNIFIAIVLQNFFEDEQRKRIEQEEKRNREYISARKLQKVAIKKDRFGHEADYRDVINKYQYKEKALLSALKVFKRVITYGKEIHARHKNDKKVELEGISLGIFNEESTFRLAVYRVVNSTIYQILLFIVMFLTTIMLSFHTSLHDPHGSLIDAVQATDIFTAIFFAIDVIIRSIAYGFVLNGQKSYLRNEWNALDLSLTVIQIISLFVPASHVEATRLLNMLSVLRIVRIVTLNEGFKLCMQAIVNGFWKIMQILFVAVMVFLAFAVVGIQLFGGRLFYCDRKNMHEGNVESVYDCMDSGGEWRDRDLSFNNIWSALIALFELFTGKSLMYLYGYLSDITDYDKEPVRDAKPYNVVYIIIFMIIGFIFIRGILTGVVNDTFSKEKETLQGFKDLTAAQMKWAQLARIIFKSHPVKSVIFPVLITSLNSIRKTLSCTRCMTYSRIHTINTLC